MQMHPNASAAPADDRPPEGCALVVDDHPLFCDALELTLRSFESYPEVRTAGKLSDAIALLDKAPPPALVLLDLNLPDVTGLDGLIELKRHARATPVVIVSSMTDDQIIRGAIAAGASGFVPKHSPRSTFREAITAIEAGGVFKPACHSEGETDDADTKVLTQLSSLTNQQARILELICEGKLNKQIAYDLSIAEATVKAHVTAIMRKLNVQSRTQAALVVQDARFSSVVPNTKG